MNAIDAFFGAQLAAPMFKNVPGVNTVLSALGLVPSPLIGPAYDQLQTLIKKQPVQVNYMQRSMQGTVNNQMALADLNTTKQELIQNEISKLQG